MIAAPERYQKLSGLWQRSGWPERSALLKRCLQRPPAPLLRIRLNIAGCGSEQSKTIGLNSRNSNNQSRLVAGGISPGVQSAPRPRHPPTLTISEKETRRLPATRSRGSVMTASRANQGGPGSAPWSKDPPYAYRAGRSPTRFSPVTVVRRESMWSGPPGRAFSCKRFRMSSRSVRPCPSMSRRTRRGKRRRNRRGPPASTCMTRSPASRFTPAALHEAIPESTACIIKPTYGLFHVPARGNFVAGSRHSVDDGIVIGLPRSKALVFKPRTLPVALTSAPPGKPGYNSQQSGRMN